MVSTRGRRRPSSNDLEELGLDGAMKPPPKTAPPSPEDEGSEERDTEAAAAEEESENSGDAKHAPAGAAPKPTATPKQAKRPSPSPPPEEEEEGAGAQGSGVAPPVRGGTLDELAAAAAAVAAAPPPHQKLKTKKTTKRLKRPPPPSQDGVEGSGDTSLARDAPPRREIVAPPDPNNSGASSPTPERAKRRATPPQEEEEQAEKRAAGSDGDGTDLPPAETVAPADKVRHKKNKKNKPGKVLAKPLQPDSAELGLAGNRGEVLHAGSTPSLQEKDDAQEEDPQRKEMAGPEDADHTSLPQVNGSAHEEEQHMEEDAGQEEQHMEEQQENSTQEDDDIGGEVSGEADRVASLAKLRSSKGTWSQDDELKILTALVEHAQSHGGALPDSSQLLANLTFDKADANADKLDDKIRKLRAKYRNRKVRPTDDHGCRLFELSRILWAEVDADARVDSTVNTRDFNELSELYPYLAKEVKVYAETHSSGDLILAAFSNIGDEKALHLDAMCKKQRFDAFKLELMKANLELSQANLTKEMLSALSSRIN